MDQNNLSGIKHFFCSQLSIHLILKRKLFAPESPNYWGFACRSLINNRFYKHSGSLGFASSKPCINNRVYKHSGPHGITNTEHSRNDMFYKQFWPCASHRLSGLKHSFCKTILQESNPGLLKRKLFAEIVLSKAIFKNQIRSF